eukprot:scaffold4538_cov410-Prasinococcus_capsulatus_cf.AAC.6
MVMNQHRSCEATPAWTRADAGTLRQRPDPAGRRSPGRGFRHPLARRIFVSAPRRGRTSACQECSCYARLTAASSVATRE